MGSLWKVEAYDDTVYIAAATLKEAKNKFKAVMGDVPSHILKWTQIDALPDGEECL